MVGLITGNENSILGLPIGLGITEADARNVVASA